MVAGFMGSAWADLSQFLDVMLGHLPSAKAVLLLALILALFAALSAAIGALIDRFTQGPPAPVAFKLVSEAGEARTVRLTKERREIQGLKEGQRVIVSLVDGGQKKRVIAELQTRKKLGAFDNEACAASLAVRRALGVEEASGENSIKLVVEELPWYSLASTAYKTIWDPDPNVRLAWIVTVVSIVVSVGVAEIYYQRALMHESSGPELRTTIHEGHM